MFLLLSESAIVPRKQVPGDFKRCGRSLARQVVVKMKAQNRDVHAGDRRRAENAQVRREIQGFLQALDSYPERFAQDPSITFEEHHVCLVRAGLSESRRRA